ncbi:MAG: carboxymuconolactone decarboxylase family protein [Bacteroidota bacterium]
MNTEVLNPTIESIGQLFSLPTGPQGAAFSNVAFAESRYARDLKINLQNALAMPNLSEKESTLLALGVAINDKSSALVAALSDKAAAIGAGSEEIAEVFACVSLMNTNNVLYRFRHFMKKEQYETPAGIKMNVMVTPVLGKGFFELLSLAVSALNGCELCVTSHEASVLKHGESTAKIYDAVRLAAIVRGFTVLNA